MEGNLPYPQCYLWRGAAIHAIQEALGMHCNDLSLHILPTYAFLQNLPNLVFYCTIKGEWPAMKEIFCSYKQMHISKVKPKVITVKVLSNRFENREEKKRRNIIAANNSLLVSWSTFESHNNFTIKTTMAHQLAEQSLLTILSVM